MWRVYVTTTLLLNSILNIILSESAGVCEPKSRAIFCYYGSWAVNRFGIGQLKAVNIHPYACTHIAYAFFDINDDGDIRTLNPRIDYELDNIADFVALKERYQGLKVMASVGGWVSGSAKYSAMASDAIKRRRFILSTVKFLLEHGFDGVDLDWEYPVQRGGRAEDYVNFLLLLKQLKQELSLHNLLLSVAVAAAEVSAAISYDVRALAAHVDFINVMTYSFTGKWSKVLGFNAPLTGEGPKTVEASINYWLQQGAPAHKLLLGIPLYGRTFTLANSTQTNFGDPNTGAGTKGPFTRTAGYLSYYEICVRFREGGWTLKWDEEHSSPYAYKGDQWITYENTQSIDKKLAFMESHHLGGVMIWAIDHDDIIGICPPNNTNFLLLKHIRRETYIPSKIPPRRDDREQTAIESA